VNAVAITAACVFCYIYNLRRHRRSTNNDNNSSSMFNVPIALRDHFFLADPYFAATWRDFDRLRDVWLEKGKNSGDERGQWRRLAADFCNRAPCMSSSDLVGNGELKK
jgi:hypothetical protein